MAGRWNTEHGHFFSEFKDLQASAMAVDRSGDWCLLAGRKNLAFVNLKRPSQPIKVTRQSKWDIGCVQWNMHASCGHRFVTACNQRLDVFDFREATASHLCSMKAHSRTVSDIDWSPFDVNVVASCSVDTFIYFWDVRKDSKKPAKSFQTVTGAYQVKWNKCTNNLFATTHDGDVRIWDPRNENTPVQYIAAHPSKIHGLDWSDTDQHKFVTASQDCTIRLWDCNSPQRSEALINSGNPVWRARYTPFGEGVLSVVVPQLRRGEYSLYLWHPKDQQVPVHTFMGHKDVILEFQWCKQQDGMRDHHLVTWSKDQSLRMWKVDPLLQKQCGHNIDTSAIDIPGVEDLTRSLKEDGDHLTNDKESDTSHNNKKHLLEEASSDKQDLENPTFQLEAFDTAASGQMQYSGLTGTSTLSTGDGRGLRGSVAGPAGLQGKMSLEQEIDEVQRAIVGVRLDQADMVKRTCVFKLVKGSLHMDAQLYFPDQYPVKVPPKLLVLASNLESDVESRVIKAFSELSVRLVKQHKNCVEPGLRHILQGMERSSISPLEQAQEDRKLMLKEKFAVEKVQLRSPTSPAQSSSSVIPMFPTGSFQDSCIPFPRTCGARFCSNDRLVTFSVPVSMKKVHEETEVTPRAFSDLITYALSQSQWMRNQSNSFASMSLFYGSSPHSTEGVSISSFYVEKTSKPRHHPRHHHSQSHYSKSQYRPRDSLDLGSSKRGSTGADRDKDKRQQKVGAVKIYDVAGINPVSRELAERYKLDMTDVQATCDHNAAVARAHDRMDLAQVWQLVSHMSHPSLRPSPNSDCGPPFAYTPFGRPLLKKMLEHYARLRDVQTMAMLCCVFWDRNSPMRGDRDSMAAVQSAPVSTSGGGAGGSGWPQLPRNESRTSLEYNAAAAMNDNKSSFEAVMKSKRSSSWSESFDDFKLQEDKDPHERAAERERVLHLNNSKMLDPDLWHQYEQIKHSYADLLFKWGLLNQRRQILKHTVPTSADYASIELIVKCWNCSEEVRGVQCSRCTYPALQCSICHIGVRGAANMCIACGHGGHLAHMAEWFREREYCPSGCGCRCLKENVI